MLKNVNLKRLVILAAFLIVIALMIAFFSKENLGPTLSFEIKPLPGNTDITSVTMNGDAMVYSNGRFLVSYNTKTSESRRLYETDVLPKISDLRVSPGNTHLIFKTEGSIAPYPQLASKVVAELPDYEGPGEGLWWLLDTQNKTVNLFSNASSPSTDWLNKEAVVYPSGFNVIKMGAINNKLESLHKGTQEISALGATQEGFMFQTADNKIFAYNLKQRKSQLLYEGYSGVTFGNRNGCFITYKEAGEDEPKVSETPAVLVGCLHGKTNKKLNLEPNLRYGIFSEDGKHFFYTYLKDESPVNKYINLETGKKGLWEVSGAPNQRDTQIIYAQDSQHVLVRVKNRFYGTGVKSPKLIEGNPSIKTTGSTVDLSGENQEVTVSKYSNYSDEDKGAVDSLLTGKGYDPLLFNIHYIVLTGDDYRWD